MNYYNGLSLFYQILVLKVTGAGCRCFWEEGRAEDEKIRS
jgi:hypothetical protein